MTNRKPWYKSWTIIGNIVAILVLVLQATNSVELFGVGTDIQAISVAILNILIRFRTSIGVSIK